MSCLTFFVFLFEKVFASNVLKTQSCLSLRAMELLKIESSRTTYIRLSKTDKGKRRIIISYKFDLENIILGIAPKRRISPVFFNFDEKRSNDTS